MKTIVLTTAILLTGCSSFDHVLNNDRSACIELQKSVSRDQTMRDIAMLEMAKSANEQTKMAILAVLNNPKQLITCK